MARIAVVGSVALDEVVRLHEPLREGRHLAGSWKGPRLGGGASCTAVPLAYAGHEVSVVGSIGLDETGDDLLTELGATGVDTSSIVRIDQPTTRSLIMVDGRGERTILNLVRTHEDEPPQRLLDLDADCVYVRSRRLDLGPLLRRKAETTLIIGHVPPTDEGSRPAHILVMSASDVEPPLLEDPLDVGHHVAGDMLEWMIVTQGGEGVVAYSSDHVLRVPAPEVSPIDTTGAGDSFAAGLAHALVSGAGMPDALEIAVAWGAEATLWNSSVLPSDAVSRLVQ